MPGILDIPFPDSTAPGTPNHGQESGGRIINGYVEPLAPTAPNTIVYRRAPGLRNFGTSARTGFRGMIEVNGLLYGAFNGQLEKWSSAGGASSNVGAMTGTKKGFFARNNAVTPDKVFVDPDNNIFTFTTVAVTSGYPDPDLPAVNSVCSIDGFLVFTTGNGRAYATDLNSTSVNALSFGTAEAKPDGLFRGLPWNGQLFLAGSSTIEVFSDQGLTPFPFARAIVLQRGIPGPYCIAGAEDGFGRALVLIGDDNCVYRLTPNSYALDKISPPDLDGLIEAVTDKTTLEVGVFVARGHAFAKIDGPTFSWAFDLNNNKWAERTSYNGGGAPTRSRIIGGYNAFGKWLCGDRLTGNIQEITTAVATEVGDPFRLRLESGPVEKFPVGHRIGRADFNFVTGVGENIGTRTTTVTGGAVGTAGRARLTVANVNNITPGGAINVAGVIGLTGATGTFPALIVDSTHVELVGSSAGGVWTSGGTITDLTPLDPTQTDPTVEISWSDDGGNTWSTPAERKLGRQAATEGLVSLVACTGRSSWNGRRWRIDVADPVYVAFMNATQAESPQVKDH